MSATWKAEWHQRQVLLRHAGQPVITVDLDQGGRYRLVAPDQLCIESAVAALEALPGVSVLPADGGLLGTLTVSANLSLALSYGQEADEPTRRDWDESLQLAMRLCGVSDERMRCMGRKPAMQLDRLERWMLGFVLRIMRPPELLIIDRALAGLSRREADAVLAMAAVYHEFHPFRPVLFVELDAHGLPPLPACRAHVELEEPACLS